MLFPQYYISDYLRRTGVSPSQIRGSPLLPKTEQENNHRIVAKKHTAVLRMLGNDSKYKIHNLVQIQS